MQKRNPITPITKGSHRIQNPPLSNFIFRPFSTNKGNFYPWNYEVKLSAIEIYSKIDIFVMSIPENSKIFLTSIDLSLARKIQPKLPGVPCVDQKPTEPDIEIPYQIPLKV